MTGLLGEIRYAARMLVKHPGVSGLAVVALGLGIGLTAIMFSLVYGALLRGLPFENGDRILTIARLDPEVDDEPDAIPYHDYVDWVEQQTSFDHLAAYYQGTVNVRWAEEPERFDGGFVTANLFAALGVQPQIGRTFRDEEDDFGAPGTVLLSHEIWMDRFAGDRDVLGQVVTVNGASAEIIGVNVKTVGNSLTI
jgi:putative ABC transport system permease protein